MKKLLSITLACLMMFALAIGTAAETTDPSVNVKVEVNEAADVTDVSVSWTSVEFTYVFNKTWNPSTHKDDVVGGWTTSSDSTLGETKTATLTITNNSNKDVTVDADYDAADLGVEDETQFENVNVTVALDKTNLNAATTSNIDTATATLTISGAPTEKEHATFKIGTIKISVS